MATTLTPAARIYDLLRGYFVSQALYAAARLGVADILAQSPDHAGSVEDLARATATDPESLYRLLRALASEGIFEEQPGRRFALNDMADTLRTDRAGSMRPAALLAGETQYKVWTLLKDTLKPGSPSGFERVFRQPLFEFFAQHPDLYANFNAAMTTRAAPITQAVLSACRVHSGDVIVDIGGGLGVILGKLLDQHPGSRGVLLETPAVITEAAAALAESPLKTRLTLIAGDCLQTVPPGDVMILVTVLHMFQDEPALRILKNCRASLAAGGRLYIAEALLRGPNEKDPGKWQDLNMMMMTGGKERTFEEFAGILHQAGFTQVQRISDIIEAQ